MEKALQKCQHVITYSICEVYQTSVSSRLYSHNSPLSPLESKEPRLYAIFVRHTIATKSEALSSVRAYWALKQNLRKSSIKHENSILTLLGLNVVNQV